MPKPYLRPEVSESEKQQILMMAHRIIATCGFASLKNRFIALCIENMCLTKEVNEHRRARGFEELQTYKPKFNTPQ